MTPCAHHPMGCTRRCRDRRAVRFVVHTAPRVYFNDQVLPGVVMVHLVQTPARPSATSTEVRVP